MSRNRTEEPALDELVQQFWRTESESVQPDRKPSSSQHKNFLGIMDNSMNFNKKDLKKDFRRKKIPSWKTNIFPPSIKLKVLIRNKNVMLNSVIIAKRFYKLNWRRNCVKPVEMQEPPPDRISYLPHHPIENPNKPAKVRRVPNAASKFRGQSLNTNLLTGPELLNSLLGVLMRFRENTVGRSPS